MITSFADKETQKIYQQEFSKKIPIDIQQTALRKLILLSNAKTILDLKSPPANKLEKLKGGREGQYSIRINDQWRICFNWNNQTVSAENVEIVDYH